MTSKFGGASGDTNAHSWFLGSGLDFRLPVSNGARHGTFLFRLTGGIERFALDEGQVHMRSFGLGARFMIVPAFIGSYQRGPYEGMGATGGKDPRGNCTTTVVIDSHGDQHPTESCNN